MSQPLSISPAKTELSLSPGETTQGELFVYNPSTTDELSFVARLAPLSFQSETYDLAFDVREDYNQILDWTTLIVPETNSASTSAASSLTHDPIVLQPGERTALHYQISVPDTAPAGSQYFAIIVTSSDATPSAPGTNSVMVKDSAGIASLVYADVAGATKRELNVLENYVPFIVLGTPISTSSFVHNSGNVHVQVSYSLTVENLLDGAEVYSNTENPEIHTIIPSTKFYSEQTWTDTPALGLYKLTQELAYLNQSSVKESYVLVAPVWFVVLVLAFLASIIFAIVERTHNYKKHRKSIKKVDINNHKDYNNKYKKVIQK